MSPGLSAFKKSIINRQGKEVVNTVFSFSRTESGVHFSEDRQLSCGQVVVDASYSGRARSAGGTNYFLRQGGVTSISQIIRKVKGGAAQRPTSFPLFYDAEIVIHGEILLLKNRANVSLANDN
jgi:hypothetical protein